MNRKNAITIESVTKAFGNLRALDNVSLEIGRGEIFGIIGPNGAGKTTLVNLITGMLAPDSGMVRTLGLDPIREERELREVLGVQFQEAELPELILVREALELYSSFYRAPRPLEPLAIEWGLGEKLTTRFGKLSGGQKQRLFICLALLNNPELVVLDELTTGLDPQARHMSWDLVRRIRDNGTTVLLVTHFMDEAEALCDRIALVDAGRIVAQGAPTELTRGTGDQSVVSFTAPPNMDADALSIFGTITTSDARVSVAGGGFLMANVAGELARQGINPSDLTTETNSLEDVFIRMTNHSAEEIRA
jgi:ABC-2 type transport system ATP-binding protein